MIERLEIIEKRYNEINQKLSTNEVLSDIKLSTKLSIEQNDIKDSYDAYQLYKNVIEDLKSAKEMLKDPEMEEFAKEEILNLEEKEIELKEKIKILLIPKDENDGKNIIMEIRGAAGGDEANIFAGDLYRMYVRYAEKEGFKIEELNLTDNPSGGFSQIEILIKGNNVYSKLKYESGAHRVQRIPTTESGGRIHTSTATVLVMPEIEDVNVEIKENDIKTDVYRSSGAGGQSVNTTDSAVRLTHLPTGIVVTCQTERSQIKNREKALQVLKMRIFEEERIKKENQIGNERKIKIGTGDRSEKIRTYNYPQNRITDHRINYSIMQLDKVMEGNLNPIIEELTKEDQKMKLEDNNGL